MRAIKYDKNVQARIRELESRRFFKEAIFVLLALVLVACVSFAFMKDSDSSLESLLRNIKPPVTTEAPTQPQWEESQLLILVNADHPIPEDYEFELKTLKDGSQVDVHMYDDLHDMFEAMRALGIVPYINSAYRSPEKQEQILNEKIAAFEAEGYSYDEAVSRAGQWVSQPEYSEHMIGLALDITADDGTDASIAELQQWLYDFSYLYGFVLRYPADKEDITGYSYEPWHYRYVGKTAARQMHDSGMCLEEYVESLGE